MENIVNWERNWYSEVRVQLLLLDFFMGDEGLPGMAAAGLAQHPLGPRHQATLWWLWWGAGGGFKSQ